MVNIRLATIDDVRGISDLVSFLAARYIAHEYSPMGSEHLLAGMTAGAVESCVRSRIYRYHVAEVNGELAGVIAMRDNAHLYHLFVGERFQRRGVARSLWEIASQTRRDHGNEFTVNSSRYAIEVYRRLGFQGGELAEMKNDVVIIP